MRNDKWMKGEFLFPLVYRMPDEPSFLITDVVFKNKEDAKKWANGREFFWPAENLEGVVFCPDQEEIGE